MKEEVCDMLKHTLGSIVVLLSPLSTLSISRLLHLPSEDVDRTFEDLYVILGIPEDPTHPLRLHHPSLHDFLLNKDRCGDFWVDEKAAHQILAAGCIQLMSHTLKKDICEMHTPGSQASEVESSVIEQCLPPEVQYACLYWVWHLQRGGSQVHSDEEAHQFLQVHLLHWLEALGWMGKMSEGIQAILSLEAHVSANERPDLLALIYDAKRFALYNRSVIKQAPLQIYCSALIFAPEKSIVRRQFEKYIPPWTQMKTKMQETWGAVLQRLEGHSDCVNSVAFSVDGLQVASGSNDKTVRLWDVATGIVLQTLKGHSDWVSSVAISPDRKQVASGSNDETVRLWDAATGVALQVLNGHLRSVNSVAFSPDGKQVVSGSRDYTICLWDALKGTALQTLKGHLGPVTSVAFSPDGKQVVSGSRDHTICLWDALKGTALQTLKGHSGRVNSVAFSPDGKQLVSGSHDETVQLWDAVTGTALRTLGSHLGRVRSVTFSPDGKQVASVSNETQFWDTTTGTALQTLKVQPGWAYSLAFSPDGKQVAIWSHSTIQLWDADTGPAQHKTLEGHSGPVSSVALSPDSNLVASGSDDGTVQLWDAVTGAVLQTLEGHSNRVNSVTFSPDSKQVASGSDDKTVRLWDATTGVALQTLEGHLGWVSIATFWRVDHWVSSVAFSPDGKQVASGSGVTVQLWDATTGAALQMLEGYPDWVKSVAFLKYSKVEQGLLVSNNWVMEGKEKILLLPHEYKPTYVAVRNRIIALGLSVGRISILRFEEGLKLI